MEGSEETVEFIAHLLEASIGARRPRDEHDVLPGAPVHTTSGLSKEALGSVASHGTPDTLRGDEGEAHAGFLRTCAMHRQEPPGTAISGGQDARDVTGRAQTERLTRDHPGQALTRARPFLRRDFTIRLPDFVRMRSRKPCFLERRRLFGWYVRFTRPSRGGG